MSDVQGLLAAYIDEHRAGGDAEPVAFLNRAAPEDRDRLAELIDGYLSRTPRRPFNPELFAQSRASRIVEEVVGGWDVQPWTVLLPQLRAQARLKRSDLVAKLAAGLGVAAKQDKVSVYYHQMEQGQLPANGVSDRVLDVLGGLIGETRERLRAAGAALTPPSGPLAAAAFARTSFGAEGEETQAADPTSAASEVSWDEVDELFRGN